MKELRKDNDGHKYMVPSELVERFDSIMDQINHYNMGSPDWHDYNDLLDYEFGKYMKG